MNQTRPTADLLKTATNEELCKMVCDFRHTPYQDTFLRLLFDLPLEVWTENDLIATDILEVLNHEERNKLLKMYWTDGDFKQHPVIELIVFSQK